MLQVPLPFSAVETSDHTISSYISDGFFSHVVCCCNGTSTRKNTHGELFKDISRSRFPPSYLFFFLLSHVLVARLLESVSFPLSTPKNFNNIWRYDTFSPNWGLLNSKDLPNPYFSNSFKENSLYWDINSDTQTDLICINNMFHVF